MTGGIEQKRTGNVLWLQIAAILLVSVAVYSNAVFNGFVSDDSSQIVDNPWIKDIGHLPEIFSKSVWNFQGSLSNYYRPLMHIIFMLTYHLFGLASWGYHAVSILFHALASVLVFLITSKLFRQSRRRISTSVLTPPLMAALLFATHPIHTEAVAWASAMPELSFTLFFLLSLYLYTLSFSENNAVSYNGKFLLSLGAFFLASLCKETALTLPIILMAYDYAFQNGHLVRRPMEALKRYVPFILVAGAYFLLRFGALGGFAPDASRPKIDIQQFVINVFPLFAGYLEKMIIPVKLNAFYIFHPIESIFDTRGVISLAVSLAFISFVLVAAKKDKAAFFSLVLIGIPLLPALYFPAITGSVFGERYLYLPSFGFVLLLAFWIDWVGARKEKWLSVTVTGVFAALLCFYSFVTVSRNAVWKDEYTFWTDTVKKSPDGAIPHYCLGTALLSLGRVDEAIDHLESALSLRPTLDTEARAHNSLGVAYAKKGLLNKAIEEFSIRLTMDPYNAIIHTNIGQAYVDSGSTDKGIEHLQIALTLKPGFVSAHENLGMAYMKKGLIDKAIEQLETALRLEPGVSRYHANLANAYEMKGWHEKAEEQRRAAASLMRGEE
ncbi:MAG TPA: tetratricopeptide repeat protein [Nitrospirota bacterium]|nr:tetratricopeptide repeat protein [Nitrospirota bacterium]